ncbi:hypothetical protein RRG08_040577 [Elysia crispata]|uniref:Uncharacterized protein n=1 Tax=Elysia crispata TaxID=231223 RepID=A0AAE0Z924_9GAST|nr:hypothetical protein RRG08_040577 [Elysia crispata]
MLSTLLPVERQGRQEAVPAAVRRVPCGVSNAVTGLFQILNTDHCLLNGLYRCPSQAAKSPAVGPTWLKNLNNRSCVLQLSELLPRCPLHNTTCLSTVLLSSTAAASFSTGHQGATFRPGQFPSSLISPHLIQLLPSSLKFSRARDLDFFEGKYRRRKRFGKRLKDPPLTLDGISHRSRFSVASVHAPSSTQCKHNELIIPREEKCRPARPVCESAGKES